MNLRLKLLLLVLFISMLTVGLFAYFTFTDNQAALEAATFNRLEKIVALEKAELRRWLNTSGGDLRELARRPLVIEGSQSLVDNELDPTLFEAIATDIREIHFRPVVNEDCCFMTVSLIRASDGRIMVSTDPSLEGMFRESEPHFIQGKESTYIAVPVYDLTQQAVVMHVSTPLVDDDGQLIAVVAGHLNMNELGVILQHDDLQGSEDTYLVNGFNFFVTESRFMTNAALNQVVYSEGVIRCLKGEDGTGIYPDYRDVKVMGAFSWIAEPGLCLVSEIDRGEALLPVKRLQVTTIQIGGVVSLLALVLSWVFTRSITQPIARLVKGTDAIAQGNFAYQIVGGGSDEIGQLTRSFNQMIQKLVNMTASRDELNREIAERARTEILLRNSEERFRHTFEYSAIGRAMVGLDGKFIQVNQALCAILGYPQAELIGKTWRAIISAAYIDTADRELLPLLNRDVPSVQFDSQAIHKEGHVIWVSLSIVLIGDSAANPLHLLADCDDITPRRQAEERLLKMNTLLERSNEELGQFAYVASHDLQEPLRMVTSYLQLLEKKYKGQLDADADEFIFYAVDGATRMRQLVNDLLAYSRVGTQGKPFAPTDCGEVLENVLQNLKILMDETEATITFDRLPSVYGDRGQLAQLFQNLVTNAIKFRGDSAPQIHIGVVDTGNTWQFCVQDNGIGIDPQFHKRIFLIFERLHNNPKIPGTGIGLAVCKRIVERHGGQIWVEPQADEGSTFYFTLHKELEGNFNGD